MFKIIGLTFKYSCLVIVVLILSHIVQIREVTISRHVENFLNWVTAFDPKSSLEKTALNLKHAADSRNTQLNQELDEVTPEDQKKLNRVIQNSK